MRRKLLYAVVILIYLAGFAAAAAPDLNRLAAAISASDVIGDFEERARGDPEDGQDTGAEDGTGEDAWDPGLSEELRRAMEEYNARIFAEGAVRHDGSPGSMNRAAWSLRTTEWRMTLRQS